VGDSGAAVVESVAACSARVSGDGFGLWERERLGNGWTEWTEWTGQVKEVRAETQMFGPRVREEGKTVQFFHRSSIRTPAALGAMTASGCVRGKDLGMWTLRPRIVGSYPGVNQSVIAAEPACAFGDAVLYSRRENGETSSTGET
jgi:hypothetical protein